MLVFILEYGLGCLPLNLAVTAERTMCLVSLVQLSSIVPLLEQAKQAVGSIDNAALAEVRAMQSPPEAVHDVLSAVLQVIALFPESHFARVSRPWECPYPPP